MTFLLLRKSVLIIIGIFMAVIFIADIYTYCPETAGYAYCDIYRHSAPHLRDYFNFKL